MIHKISYSFKMLFYACLSCFLGKHMNICLPERYQPSKKERIVRKNLFWLNLSTIIPALLLLDLRFYYSLMTLAQFHSLS